MALNIQCATLTQGASGVGGVQTIELGDNFNPVCGIVLAATVAADGIAANASMSIGFFSYRGGVAQQGCTSWISRDNVGTASSKQRQRMTECAVLMTNATGTTVDYQVSFTGLTTGVGSDITFDITNGHTTAGVRAFIMVFGGSDVLDAEAHTFTLVSPTGAQDVPLGSGFGHPQCVFFVADAWANSASVNSHATPSFGFGVLNGGDRCWSWCSQEAVTTQATSQGIGNTAALTLTDPGFGIENAFSLAAEAGFPTDGYEISKSTVTDGEDVIALAIQV